MQPNPALPISISRNSGHWLRISDRYREEVGDFQVTRYEGTADGQVVAVQQSLLDESLMSSSSAGFTFPAAGLLPALEHAARELQVPLDIVRSNTMDLPEPVRSPLSQNPAIADFIREFQSGMIEYGGAMSVVRILAEICLAYPGIRILMVSPNRREIRNVYENVQRHAPLVSVIDVSRGELPWDVQDVSEVERCQLVLTTPVNAAMLFDTAGTDVREFSIVIFSNAARVKDLMTSGFLMASYARFRIFGLRSLSSAFRGEESELALNVFGPVCVRIPDNGFEQSDVSCIFLKNRFKLQNLRPRSSPVDAIRLTPHSNQRNNLIGNIARDLVNASRFEDDDLVHHWLHQHGIQTPTVAIFVLTYLHAARLAQRLPDWNIFLPDDSAEILDGIPARDRRLINARAIQRPCNNKVICPLDYLPTFLESVDPQIIVVASGGLHAPKFPRSWFQHPAGIERHRLVIDLFDGASALTRRLSKQRRALYRFPDFLPVMPDESREDVLVGLPVPELIERTFQPARRRRSP